ncbi:MAG: ankyrin repeat domain-containing protein [Candidatus Aminicenantes bacterium]|nr:ankyrin repeat domain-containing protein [Candidatus Aminicenantes bacterium]
MDRVQEIVKFNPDVDVKNNSGQTPPHLAVGRHDNAEVIEILLDREDESSRHG